MLGNVLPTQALFNQLKEKLNDFCNSEDSLNEPLCFTVNDLPIAYFLSEYDEEFVNSFSTSSEKERPYRKVELEEVKILDFIWDAIEYNGLAIEDDFHFFKQNSFPKMDNVSLINSEKISLADTAEIMPGVVLDASQGAIIIDENVKVMPNSVVIGPCYIGKNSTIKVGAKFMKKLP